MGFFEDHFISPIWDKTGYNAINTPVYAVIALAAAYMMYLILKKEKIRIDRNFVLSVIPFILLGSTLRSLVDAVDRGTMQANADALFGLLGFIYSTHIYDYGYLTVSPGIYIVIGLLTFFSVLAANRLKKPMLAPAFGGVLWAFHFILLVPMMKYLAFGALVIALALLGGAAGYLYLKRQGLRPFASIAVFAHALDGAATYVTIDLWNRFEPLCTELRHCYGEQHILSDAIGQFGNVFFGPGRIYLGGFFLFYLVKLLFSGAAAVVIEKDSKGDEKDFILLLLIIFGFAPGMRDLLTLLMGA
ncbi:MAG: DUF63 family protein [Candidatus Micrarchaeota archaeon]